MEACVAVVPVTTSSLLSGAAQLFWPQYFETSEAWLVEEGRDVLMQLNACECRAGEGLLAPQGGTHAEPCV